MQKAKEILVKWCDKPWLITTYILGFVMFVVSVFFWKGWGMPRRFLALIAITLPIHVFEENTYPDGFHYMMNLVQKSENPNAGPMNKLSNMISNFGGEILFLILVIWGGNIGSSILVAFFGIGESIVHTLFGFLTYRELKIKGMKTIYGPGSLSAYLTMLPVSVYTISWLLTQNITKTDLLTGIFLIACVIALLIRMPIMLFGKFQPEYEFKSSGYFGKFK